jgi:starch synthase
VVFVANGDYQQTFRDIVNQHGFHSRVAVCDFNESMEHLAYAAADFILMPSLFEPCGLPQMIAPIYGALPVAHDTGGIHDTFRRPAAVKAKQVSRIMRSGLDVFTHEYNARQYIELYEKMLERPLII